MAATCSQHLPASLATCGAVWSPDHLAQHTWRTFSHLSTVYTTSSTSCVYSNTACLQLSTATYIQPLSTAVYSNTHTASVYSSTQLVAVPSHSPPPPQLLPHTLLLDDRCVWGERAGGSPWTCPVSGSSLKVSLRGRAKFLVDEKRNARLDVT